jgi:HEAT repeat protein
MKTKTMYLLLGCVVGAIAHAAPMRAIDGTPMPDMNERILQEKYHIASTKDGLVAALGHPSSDVRSFAALKLAIDGQKDTTPAILSALAVEALQGVQINLALAAAQLGAEGGTLALRGMCENVSWSGGLKMAAAQAMLSLNREDCLADVLGVLRSAADDQQAVTQALNLLPRFKHVPDQDLQEMKDLIAMHLKSNSLAARIAAVHTIKEIGDGSAVEQLRGALAVELDDTARRVILADLEALAPK